MREDAGKPEGMNMARLRSAMTGLCGLAALALAPATASAQFSDPGAAAPVMRDVSGMIMVDYSPIRLTTGGSFDLMSYRYLQNMNDWLSFGVGAFAPMVEGNYGGFYGADLSFHAQRGIGGNWFVNGGLALGIGAGGASVSGIRSLSGEGVYGRAYAGIGYAARYLNIGVNVSRVGIVDSPIDDTTISVFVQRPLGFAVGSYGDSGRTIRADQFSSPRQANILSFEYNHIGQINPQGLYRGDIGAVSPQFTHFLNRDFYTFFGVEIGVIGLDWYNQAQAGFGRRFQLSDRVNAYAQLGIGSAGWVADTIDTGPGMVLYPKATLEYMVTENVGATLSAGYIYAPFATSRSWTLGLGLNYHLSRGRSADPQTAAAESYTLHGIRLNVMGRMTSPIYYNGRETEGIPMVAVQADYSLNENWYAAAHLAVAATRFRGYAGYAEGFVGLGWQTDLTSDGRMQGYAQLLYGLNDVGVSSVHKVGPLIYPALGVNYHVTDRVSLYGQIGATTSIGRFLDSSITNRFENYSVGFGLTYRFALPTRS